MFKALLLSTTLLFAIPAYTHTSQAVELQDSPEKLHEYAELLVKDLKENFKPQDLIFLTYRAAVLVETDADLTLDEKRAGVVAVLNEVIDNTDTPYLPDYIFDPVFKLFLPPFVALMIQDNTIVSTGIPIYSVPASKDANAFANEMINFYGPIYKPEKMPAYIQAVVAESNRYKNLNAQQKLHFAQNAYGYFLEKSDVDQVPDFFVDPILNVLGDWMLAELIK
ncbi:MAG: hypothetical protein JSR39_01275 [Verrucomicrobia bacterium]|nr:hypothetical protein [Verrucomicrobiota bacterium]